MNGFAWPDSYIDWAGRANPRVLEETRWRIDRYPILQPEVPQLAAEAVRQALRLADDHRRYPGYFADFNAFRHWLSEVAYREALRLLPGLPSVQPLFYQLPDEQRWLLHWLYVDQLTDRQAAQVLETDAKDVRRRGLLAYDAFCQLLIARYGHDDSTFPLFPSGVGWPRPDREVPVDQEE
jgi:hypothetical protein